jgi:hypothetical protein
MHQQMRIKKPPHETREVAFCAYGKYLIASIPKTQYIPLLHGKYCSMWRDHMAKSERAEYGQYDQKNFHVSGHCTEPQKVHQLKSNADI